MKLKTRFFTNAHCESNDGNSNRTVILTLNLLVLLFFSFTNSLFAEPKVYHTEFSTGGIDTSEIDGSSLSSLSDVGTQTLDVEVDLAHGYAYWTSFGTGGVYRVKDTGGTATAIYPAATNSNAYGLALDPDNDRLFWSRWNQMEIRCGNLDGSAAEVVLHTSTDRVADLEYDSVNQKLYWTQVE